MRSFWLVHNVHAIVRISNDIHQSGGCYLKERSNGSLSEMKAWQQQIVVLRMALHVAGHVRAQRHDF